MKKTINLKLPSMRSSPISHRSIFGVFTLLVLATNAQPDLFGGSSELQHPQSNLLVAFDSAPQIEAPESTENLFTDDGTDSNEALLSTPLSSFSSSEPIFDEDLFPVTAIDCPSPDLLPPIGKSKSRSRRRRDTLPICKTPASGSFTRPGEGDLDLPKLPTKLDDLDFQEQGAASDKRRQHPNCPIYSAGILPYGVCSSWNRDDKTPSRVQPLPAEWGPYDVWDVHHCFLSPDSVMCPDMGQDFYCYMTVEELPGNIEGKTCILYRELFWTSMNRIISP